MRPDRQTSLTFILSAALAAAMHGVVLAVALYWPMPRAHDVPSEVIAVELIDVKEWEAAAAAERLAGVAQAEPAKETAAAAVSRQPSPDPPVTESMPPEITDTAESGPPPLTSRHDGQTPSSPPATAPEPAEIAPVMAAAAAVPGPRVLTPSPKPETMTPSPLIVTVQKPRKSAARPRPTQQHPAKTKTAPASTARKKAPAAAKSAARGGGKTGKAANGFLTAPTASLGSYKATVRKLIANHKPRGVTRRPVLISFAIAPSGALRYAAIAASSGNASLDQAALAAVKRAAPFPPPPAGASPGQLQLSVPFYSR